MLCHLTQCVLAILHCSEKDFAELSIKKKVVEMRGRGKGGCIPREYCFLLPASMEVFAVPRRAQPHRFFLHTFSIHSFGTHLNPAMFISVTFFFRFQGSVGYCAMFEVLSTKSAILVLSAEGCLLGLGVYSFHATPRDTALTAPAKYYLCFCK